MSWWPTEGDEPDPRWSLANERTLLAYNRTALAFVVAGLAVTGSRAISETPTWLAAIGLPLLAMGAVVALAGRRRFIANQQAMRTGDPLSAPTMAAAVPRALAAVALAGLVFGVVELIG